MSIQLTHPSTYNDHGFGVEAIEAIAGALHKLTGSCGCEAAGDEEPGGCRYEHFFAHAEEALRVLSGGLALPSPRCSRCGRPPSGFCGETGDFHLTESTG